MGYINYVHLIKNISESNHSNLWRKEKYYVGHVAFNSYENRTTIVNANKSTSSWEEEDSWQPAIPRLRVRVPTKSANN